MKTKIDDLQPAPFIELSDEESALVSGGATTFCHTGDTHQVDIDNNGAPGQNII